MSVPDTDIARVRRWVAEQNERIGEHIRCVDPLRDAAFDVEVCLPAFVDPN